MKKFRILRSRKVSNNNPPHKKQSISKGHTVMVIAGDHKGTISKVVRVIQQQFVYLADVFAEKKKINKEKKEEVVIQFRKIHVSNLMHYCAETSSRTRIFRKLNEQGKNSIFYLSSKSEVPATFVKKARDESVSEIKLDEDTSVESPQVNESSENNEKT